MVLHMKTTCRLFKEYFTGTVPQGSRTSFFPIISLSPRPLIQDRRYFRDGEFPQIFTTGRVLYIMTQQCRWHRWSSEDPAVTFTKFVRLQLSLKEQSNQIKQGWILSPTFQAKVKKMSAVPRAFFLPNGVLENAESISNSNILVNSKSFGCKTGAQNRDNWWRKKTAKNFVRLSL
jgi:hypothetical protein